MSDWKVIQLSQEDWVKNFSENMHKIVFKEIKPAHRDRISYALLVAKADAVVGYVTVRELDDENVYWQFGGVLPQYQGSMTAVRCIGEAVEWQRQRSKRIRTYVENTNSRMLRFWMASDFLVIGTHTFNGHVMVDLLKELQGGN
jgi:GNAT superfamily N-acetyltransferase